MDISKNKRVNKLLLIQIFVIFFISSYAQDLEADLKKIKLEPGLITAHNISSGLHEHSGLDISPKGDFAFWAISLKGHKIILQLKKENSKWSEPEVAKFSGQFQDEYHFFSPTGDTLFFMSYRPVKEGEDIRKHFTHWFTVFDGQDWTTPIQNKEFHQELWSYSMDKNNIVYGWCNLDTMKNDADIYFQKRVNGKYKNPQLLSDSINTDAVEYCPCISPDGNYIVFGRMGTGNKDGLYISYKKNDSSWSTAKRLPAEINKGYAERFPQN
jgi:hypothetical protein